MGLICYHALQIKKCTSCVFKDHGCHFQRIYPQILGSLLGQLDGVQFVKIPSVGFTSHAGSLPIYAYFVELEEM